MKNLTRFLLLILVALGPTALRGGPDDYAPAAADSTGTAPLFKTDSELRPGPPTGTSVTVYGGATAFQKGTLHITSPALPGFELNGRTKSSVGGAGGIKMGYTWPGFSAIGAAPTAARSADLLQPAVMTDFFWQGYHYRAADASFNSGGSLTADVDSFTFQVEPALKFNLGAVRPYIGFGLGGTYTTADHAHVQVPGLGGLDLTGSSSDFDFSVSGIAGVEIFFAANWAFMLEYKYVQVVSPDFHGDIPGSTIKYHLDGLGSQVLTAGISCYF